MPALRLRYLITAIAALGLLAASCGGDDEPAATAAPSAAVTATSTAAPAATATPTASPTSTASPAPTATPSPTASPTPTPTPEPTATATPAPTQAPAASPSTAARATDIQSIAFEGRIEVEVGTTVTWTNQDGVFHTVTADDRSSDSGTLSQGQTFSLTFGQSGTFSYSCSIHPFMQGVVVVGDGEGTSAPTSAVIGGSGGATSAVSTNDDSGYGGY